MAGLALPRPFADTLSRNELPLSPTAVHKCHVDGAGHPHFTTTCFACVLIDKIKVTRPLAQVLQTYFPYCPFCLCLCALPHPLLLTPHLWVEVVGRRLCTCTARSNPRCSAWRFLSSVSLCLLFPFPQHSLQSCPAACPDTAEKLASWSGKGRILCLQLCPLS